jgi:DNA processing protein
MTRLLQHFGTPESVFEASLEELRQVPGLSTQTAQAITAASIDSAYAILSACKAHDITVTTWADADYPSLLLRTGDAPPVLFQRGDLHAPDTRAVAIVGTRSPTPDGSELAHRCAFELARREWAIISGLALGIDTAAHEAALRAGGRTVAVLGCGLGKVYPPQNIDLARRIILNGALLSEQLPQAPVSAQSLVARNRITSGLSRAVIVIQSHADSGSRATARRALAQGRAVYYVCNGENAVPAPLETGEHLLDLRAITWGQFGDELEALPLGREPSAANGQLRLFD